MVPQRVSRRQAVRSLGLAGIGIGVGACGPAAAPPPSAETGGTGTWEQEWDRLVKAAKQEGSLVVLTLAGAGYRKALDVFQDTFGVAVEHQAFVSASIFAPRILQERAAGIFSFDAAQVSPGTALRELKPEGVWDPVRPALFRPDVLDDKAWYGGFEGSFADTAKQFAFSGFEYDVRRSFAINTDLVQPAEIKTVKDLLNPKWKGKMLFLDVRVGDAHQTFTAIRLNLGEEVVKLLLVDQEPTFTRDVRQAVEAVVRGRYPVVLGARPNILKEFQDEGLGRNVKHLDLPEADYIPSTSVFLFNRAPHPNAAKLFVNWVLTKEGQTIWSGHAGTNSRRTDVAPVNKETVPTPGRTYNDSNKEELFHEIIKTQQLIRELAGIKD